MLVLGGTALFAIRKANSWLILLVVECGNAVLLFVIMVRTLLARPVEGAGTFRADHHGKNSGSRKSPIPRKFRFQVRGVVRLWELFFEIRKNGSWYFPRRAWLTEGLVSGRIKP